jgi:hypothetical protein
MLYCILLKECLLSFPRLSLAVLIADINPPKISAHQFNLIDSLLHIGAYSIPLTKWLLGDNVIIL